MHQLPHQHAFTPLLLQPPTMHAAAAAVGPQDMNRLRGQTQRSQFAPVTAFHRASQKSFSSKVTGRWGALHVCIAWKIYYHKQLERVQENRSGLHPELKSGSPAGSLQSSAQHKVLDAPAHTQAHADSQHRHLVYENIGERGEGGKTSTSIGPSRSYPSYLHTSCHGAALKGDKPDWETLDQHPDLHWREKPDEGNTHRSSHTDKPRHAKDLPEVDRRRSSLTVRKRQFECDGSGRMKRAKQELLDFHCQPSYLTTAPYLSSHTGQVQHFNSSDLSVMYPNSSRYNVSYPGAGLHPYRTAAWETSWDTHKRLDLHLRQSVPRDGSQDACRPVGTPNITQRHRKEAPGGFFAPSLCFPVALRQQDALYLRGRGALSSGEGHSPLQVTTTSRWPLGNIPQAARSLRGPSDRHAQQIFH